MIGRLKCYLGWHKWLTWNEGGSQQKQCARCNRFEGNVRFGDWHCRTIVQPKPPDLIKATR